MMAWRSKEVTYLNLLAPQFDLDYMIFVSVNQSIMYHLIAYILEYYIAADGFVVQTGDPEGPAEGFIAPSTEKTRTIPLEIMVEGEKAPFYESTLEVSLLILIMMKALQHPQILSVMLVPMN